MSYIADNLQIPILIPLWIFLLLIFADLFNLKLSRLVVMLSSIGSIFFCVIYSAIGLKYFFDAPQYVKEISFTFLKVNKINFELGCFADYLSLLLTFCVSAVCLFSQIYAMYNLHTHNKINRLFAVLNLIYFSLIGFVLSPNLFQTLIFSVLTTVSVCMLIGYNYDNEDSSVCAQNVFYTGIAADILLTFSFMVISALIYNYTGVSDFLSVAFINLSDIGNYLYSYTNETIFLIICLLLILGFLLKIVILPVIAWIFDYDEKPVPVLSLVYASLICINSLYMIRRFYDVYAQSDFVLNIALILSLLIFFICLYYSFVKNNDVTDLFIYFVKNKVYKNICNLMDFIDRYVIKGLFSLNIYIARSLSWVFNRLQSGNIQSYVVYGMLLLSIIFVLLIAAYSLILNYGLYGG